jgi:hypothetical protein
MPLQALYTKYFQKSKVFLYPLLEIKKGSPAIPTETYLSWGTSYSTEDAKLVCVYHTRTDPEYISFEKNILFKHTRLSDHVVVDSTTSIFTFDFSDLQNDWNYIVNGKYSKIKNNLKRIILEHFNSNSANKIYIESYLYPEKYFDDYANILKVDVDLLQFVGELCSKPDLEKEKLLIEVVDLENIKILD